MLALALARRLRDAGLHWAPGQGDRFVVDRAALAEDVFVLADMTVEVHDLPFGRVVGFNGTTEWALDSVQLEDALWLPREEQLRGLLHDRFARLERRPGGWAVVLQEPAREHVAADAEDAYALAVLETLGHG